jgi:hypothetical protein
MKALLAVLLIATGCSTAADPVKQTRPKTILVIRHAEKPDDKNDIHLSAEGKKRADALPGLFNKTASRPDPFPTPDFIIAAMESKHSNRSIETVTPLSKELKQKVIAEFLDEEFDKQATQLFTNPKYEGKTVLVCWHHGKIPELLHALGIDPKPKKIDEAVFDRVWVVSFGEKGKNTPLVKRSQALMPGDAKE